MATSNGTAPAAVPITSGAAAADVQPAAGEQLPATTGKAKRPSRARKPPATPSASARAKAKPATIAARRKKFLARLSETANVTRSAHEARLSTSALYAHRARSQSFAAAWDEAIDAAMDELEDALIDRAKHGVERPVFFGGKLVGTVRNYSDALGMFLLKAKRPEVYNRLKAESAVEQSVDDARTEVMRRLERLDDDEDGAP